MLTSLLSFLRAEEDRLRVGIATLAVDPSFRIGGEVPRNLVIRKNKILHVLSNPHSYSGIQLLDFVVSQLA